MERSFSLQKIPEVKGQALLLTLSPSRGWNLEPLGTTRPVTLVYEVNLAV